MILNVTQIETEVIEASQVRPIVVDFWASWCAPCKALGPILEKLADENEGHWDLAKVDVDQYPEAAEMFGIQSMPTVMLLHKGEVLSGFQGAYPEPEVRKWLADFMPSQAEVDEKDLLSQAQERLLSGDEAGAKALFLRVMADDLDNEEARVGVARTGLFEAPDEVVALLEPIKMNSDFYDQAQHLRWLANALTRDLGNLSEPARLREFYQAGLQALRARKFDEAFDHFLEVLYRDRSYEESGAHKGFLAINNFLGKDHPTVKAYKRRLEMALF